MFRRIRDAYSNLAAILNSHAETWKAADDKVRALYGLDDEPEAIEGPPLRLPEAAQELAEEPKAKQQRRAVK